MKNKKNTGIIRNLDSLGRIVLPKEMRKTLDIDEKDPVEIIIEEDRIILRKYVPTDIFTGERNDLIDYCGKKVSLNSIKEMAQLAGLM